MTKKWMAISLVLAIVAGLLGWWLHASIRQFNADNDLRKLQPSPDMKQQMAREQSPPQLPQPGTYIPEEFAVIPENNLFSESRSSAEETTDDVAEAEAQPLLQKPILVGINITDDQKTALLIDPQAPSQGLNRRAEIKRVGDVFQGHTISDIGPDHIVLESGSQKEIIPLHEGSKQTSGGKTPILSTRVVSFGGGSPSGGTPVVSSAPSVAAARTAAAPKKSAPVAAAQPKVAPTATATVTPVRQTSAVSAARAQSTQRSRSQQASPNTGSSAPQTRVIRTPFGDIVRPVRD